MAARLLSNVDERGRKTQGSQPLTTQEGAVVDECDACGIRDDKAVCSEVIGKLRRLQQRYSKMEALSIRTEHRNNRQGSVLVHLHDRRNAWTHITAVPILNNTSTPANGGRL